MHTQLRTLVWLSCAVSFLSISHPAVAGEWAHVRGDDGATGRNGGTGDIAPEEGTSPAISWSLEITEPNLPEPHLIDCNGDGTDDAVFVYRGRVAAFDLTNDAFLWNSIPLGVDSIFGLADIDGDGVDNELIATKGPPNGGVYILDLNFGGLLGALEELPDRSGVRAVELAVGDVDLDGADEVIIPAGTNGADWLLLVDFGDDLNAPSIAEATLEYYLVFTPARTGRFLPGGEMGIAITQGSRYSLWKACEPTDPDALCPPSGQGTCICSVDIYPWVNLQIDVSSPLQIVDTEGDGIDELVEINSHPSYARSLAVLSFSDALTAGGSSAGDVIRWSRDYGDHYSPTDPKTILRGPSQPLRDLDANGIVDLVVSFFNNSSLETDYYGDLVDDGIDHPGALSAAVIDTVTGETRVFLEDAFAYGYVDLDHDGVWEIVTSPTSRWTWLDGIQGYELNCSTEPCSLDLAWSFPDHVLEPQLGGLNDLGMPEARVLLTDADGDGFDELLAYQGNELHALSTDGEGGPLIVATTTLGDDEVLNTASDTGQGVLVTSSNTMRVVNSSLAAVGPTSAIPIQGWKPWNAVRVDGNSGRAAAVFEGKVYTGSEPPTGPQDATFALLPHFALGEDLDGDGNPEFVSYSNTADNPDSGLIVRLDEYDVSSGAVQTRWTVDETLDAQLEGMATGPALQFATGDFDGEGARDLAFTLSGNGAYRVAIVDGDTGALDALLEPATFHASKAPLLIADIASPDGSLVGDLRDDVLYQGANTLQLLVVGHDGPVVETPGFIYTVVSANADVDGDGATDIVATLSATATNQMVAFSGDAEPTPLWGPQPLGRPTRNFDVLALCDCDLHPGLDPVYVTGDSGLDVYSGATGELLPGYPTWMGDGAQLLELPLSGETPTSVIVLDVDGDGHDEAIVGTDGSWLYAFNIALAETDQPTLAWSVELSAAIRFLAAADVDGDGADEILVSTEDGRGSVLDSPVIALAITSPTPEDCLENRKVTVTGTSTGVSSVLLLADGILGTATLDAATGAWEGAVYFMGPGLHEIRVEAYNAEGTLQTVTTTLVTFPGDADGDGVTECGGDCDDSDPGIYEGLAEICEDGIDQDCNGKDIECPEGDDDDSAPDLADEQGPAIELPALSSCDCNTTSSLHSVAPGPLGFLLLSAVVLATRRRARVLKGALLKWHQP